MNSIRVAALFSIGMAVVAADVQASSPNVVLIVTDDQGYGDIACNGNPHLSTPNLDRLRASSVALEDYHVDPVCTPTRAALLTGRYCGRVGAWAVTHGRQLLHADETTMADVFRDNGYRTAMFGKWHLGDSWPYDPGSRGFDEVVCCRAGGVDEIGNPVGNDYFDDVYYRNGAPERFDGYCTDVFFREAARFVREVSSADHARPFFLYLPTNAMHSPFGVSEEYSRRFRESGMPENRARFYGMIENFDENLGRLLSTLDRLGRADDTIVIFMGDNGTAANSGSEGAFNAGMRGVKGSVYEGGHRVACFVRWPEGLRGGRSVDRLTSHRDWLPTLIDLCGLQPPAGVEFDGLSIAALLRGDATEWPDRRVVVERQGTDPKPAVAGYRPNGLPQYAVLTERWRLVNGELYDIQADPAQATDVSHENESIAESLESHYREYFRDVYSNLDDAPRFIVGAPEASSLQFTVRDWRPTEGGVIWEMGQLEREDLFINGYWPVEITQPGDYRIEFSRFPFDAARPIGADEASLQIGAVSLARRLDPAATNVEFVARLEAGVTRLRGELRDAATQRTRGPYFVRIGRVDEAGGR